MQGILKDWYGMHQCSSSSRCQMVRDSEIEEMGEGDGYGVTYGGSRLSQSLRDKVVLYACK